ncbi:hypothetical protein [Tepidibacillus fermentans]|uniref:Uncharacterized protein n=1 Tax=Tepidibacillus fermentans TaxID=1281767 RepID=A0A4R3KCL1_9BACI|nr:hypothetical protein [Tepidibacillus fermentans]TCS80371.1 hypothetical protein EDD72_11738 [Tepidibacillus fermentans]
MIPYDKYKNIEEFREDIDTVGEIIFKYRDKEYSLTYDGEKIFIAESYKQETEQVFNGIEDFLNNYKIDGTSIKDLATKIKVISH